MSNRDTDILIDDIREAIATITGYVEGMDGGAFMADGKTVDAVVRNLEIIGEATKQLPDEFKASHPAIPWPQMAGLRNRIVHDYAGIDLELIWQILAESLPLLRAHLDAID